jgi:hypothetical protein
LSCNPDFSKSIDVNLRWKGMVMLVFPGDCQI